MSENKKNDVQTTLHQIVKHDFMIRVCKSPSLGRGVLNRVTSAGEKHKITIINHLSRKRERAVVTRKARGRVYDIKKPADLSRFTPVDLSTLTVVSSDDEFTPVKAVVQKGKRKKVEISVPVEEDKESSVVSKKAKLEKKKVEKAATSGTSKRKAQKKLQVY